MGCLLNWFPKFYNNVFLFFYLTLLLSFDWLFQYVDSLSVQTFEPLIIIYNWDKFVYQHWGCKSIQLPLSCPFRTLAKCYYSKFMCAHTQLGEPIFRPHKIQSYLEELMIKPLYQVRTMDILLLGCCTRFSYTHFNTYEVMRAAG